jgi:hypothetical protein
MASRPTHLFKHATSHLSGGNGADQVDGITDLTAVQQMLSAADPGTNNLCDLHAHNIINQLIEGFSSVHAANSANGTPTVPENDVSEPAQPPTVDAFTHHVTTSMHHMHHVHHAAPSQPAQPPAQTQTADTTHDAAPPPAETQPPTVGSSTDPVTPSQPAQPPTQTQTADTTHDAAPPPAETQPPIVGSSTDPVTPSQPAQPPTQTQTADTTHDAAPPPAETQPPTAGQPVNLTHSTTAIHSSHDGQIIENLDLYVDHGDAITITNDNVILRNCRIHYADGNGVQVSGANHVTIENCEIIDTAPPSGEQQGTNVDSNDINVENSPNLTVHDVTVRDGSSGMYLLNSPGANISHVDGYDFHGPFPRGQFVQFDKSGDSTLTDFYVLNHAGTSSPEDNVSVYASPNTTISNGVIDGNNSRTGVAVMFENGSTGGRVENVDAIHQGDGAFSAYNSDVVFDHTRSFDNINTDQGRGLNASNALIWNVSGSNVSILNSTYTDPANPNNIVWQARQATVVDVHQDPNATPMEHIVNQYIWS